MSTRANILILDDAIDLKVNKKISKKQLNKFKNENVLYIHSDGYPSGLLNWLIDFLNIEGVQYRAGHGSYLISWMATYHNITKMSKYLIDFEKKENKSLNFNEKWELRDHYKFNENDFKYLEDCRGSGIYKIDLEAWDIDYNYIICPSPKSENIYKFYDIEEHFNIYVTDGNFKVLYKLSENESKENINKME